ncbi:MAG: hypothetical protein FWD18_06930 [Micrococcales bacterium]|nr:hypothetical protein [Micrococcales bacterium]
MTDAQRVAELTQTLAPQVETDRATTEAVGSGFSASTDFGDINLPADPTEADLTLIAEDRSLHVSLPPEARTNDGQAVEDGLTVYPAATPDDAAMAVEAFEDGSVRIQTIIPHAQAPHEFTYGLSVPTGGRIELTEEGGALVLDAEGAFVAGAAPRGPKTRAAPTWPRTTRSAPPTWCR